jgi:hypothetical protein
MSCIIPTYPYHTPSLIVIFPTPHMTLHPPLHRCVRQTSSRRLRLGLSITHHPSSFHFVQYKTVSPDVTHIKKIWHEAANKDLVVGFEETVSQRPLTITGTRCERTPILNRLGQLRAWDWPLRISASKQRSQRTAKLATRCWEPLFRGPD